MRFEGKERRGKEKGCGSHQKKHCECRKDYVHNDVHIVATSVCRAYKYPHYLCMKVHSIPSCGFVRISRNILMSTCNVVVKQIYRCLYETKFDYNSCFILWQRSCNFNDESLLNVLIYIHILRL